MNIRRLKRNNIFKRIILLILILWIGLSIIRTLNNASKIFLEEISWLKLSDTQKRERLFGQDHVIFESLKKKFKKDSKFLIFSYDGKPYYYGRYVLYPQKIYLASDLRSFTLIHKKNKFDLIILYKINLKDSEFVKKYIDINGIQSKIIAYE